MSGIERTTTEAEVCPKRVWVLSVLADDEALGENQELPRGLAFHLSRCPSCRAIADQVTRASRGLDELGAASLPDGLLEAANRQAKEALRTGGRPTGRVIVDDDADFPATHLQRRSRRWVVGARYAAAAAVVFVVATFGFSAFRDASGRFPGSGRAVVDHAPQDGVSPIAVRAKRTRRSGERVAIGTTSSVLLGPVFEEPLPVSPAAFVDIGNPFPDASFVETPYRSKLDMNGAPHLVQEPHRHRHSERRGAAWCSDPRCIPTAVVLPGGARRMMQSAPAPIDRRP